MNKQLKEIIRIIHQPAGRLKELDSIASHVNQAQIIFPLAANHQSFQLTRMGCLLDLTTPVREALSITLPSLHPQVKGNETPGVAKSNQFNCLIVHAHQVGRPAGFQHKTLGFYQRAPLR